MLLDILSAGYRKNLLVFNVKDLRRYLYRQNAGVMKKALDRSGGRHARKARHCWKTNDLQTLFHLRVVFFYVSRTASLKHFPASSNTLESVEKQVSDRRLRRVIKLKV